MAHRNGGAFSIVLASAALACLAVTPARASFIVNILQNGSNVVASGSGSLDLTGLTATPDSTSAAARIQANLGIFALGFSANLDGYTGFSGPGNFGTGGTIAASTQSGVRVTMQGTNASFPPTNNLLYVPAGYVSGTALLNQGVFNNTTLSNMGLVTGTYVWSWNSSPGVLGDQLILNIGVVPEPSSLSLLALGVMALTVRWRRRGAQAVQA